MTPRQQLPRAALALTKRFEGYRRTAARLPDGRWMLGYGHTLSAREGAEVSEADAEALLIYDLMRVEAALRDLIFSPLSANEAAALTAFAFAIGVEAFAGSEVLKLVNAGEHVRAAYAIEQWRRAEIGGEMLLVDALVRRRAAEKLLFLTPPDGAWPVAPAALLRARPDRELRGEAPVGPAVAIGVSLDEAEAALRLEPQENAVMAAAEAVTARLQALFPEAVPEPAQESAPDEAAPLEDEPQPVRDDLAMPAPPGAEEPMPRLVQEEAPRYEFAAAPAARVVEPDGGPLVIFALTLLGLAFFAGGIFWALNARPGPEGGVFTPLLVGWLAGVAGIGFVAAAVFMLLQRIGRELRH
jgi:lysozyme